MTEIEAQPPRAPLPALERLQRVDLSQPLSNDSALWNGNRAADVAVESLAVDHHVPGAEICFTRLTIVSHTGTHVDAAKHFFPDGRAIDEYELGRFVCPAVALDARREGALPLTREELEAADPGIRPGDAVFIYFGYAERFGSESYYEHPYLAPAAAEYLVERGVALVGVDTLTPDLPSVARPDDGYDFPIHSTLLGDDVLIIENLGPNLAKLVGRRFLLVAAPLRIAGGDASPVVPIALIEQEDPSAEI
jgi:kynurenine formamidase